MLEKYQPFMLLLHKQLDTEPQGIFAFGSLSNVVRLIV